MGSDNCFEIVILLAGNASIELPRRLPSDFSLGIELKRALDDICNRTSFALGQTTRQIARAGAADS